MWRVYEYTGLTGRPQVSPKAALCTNGVGGGYEIPNIPENKTRSGFGLERIKIRENAPQAAIIF
jgi:hypothetical protein